MTTSHELEARQLTLGYASRPVIEGLDLRIPAGKISALVGPNGCGKSTLLKGLARILDAEGGAALLDGRAIHQMPTREVARLMGMLPQGPVAPEGLSVREIVALGRYPHQRWWQRSESEDERAITEALGITGLDEFASRALETLSGGQRQRAWIAMALAQQTPILLLDEPTTFLDVAHQLEVLDLLFDLNRQQQRTVVMVLHDLNQAIRYADHLFLLKQGKLFAEGAPGEVINERNLLEVFGVRCRIVIDAELGIPVCIPLGRRNTAAPAPSLSPSIP